ncbi:MAG: M28 family peptidase [Clostridia bacterium]|nr:M28 family peptidase [Clostridia bacterium]
MSDEYKKYQDEAYDIVVHASENIGSRLPGTENERRFHTYMAEKLEAIGIKPVKEEFAVAPRAGIGGLPYAGYTGLILSIGAFLAHSIPSVWYLMAALGILMLFWLVASCFFYRTWFDKFFKQKISQNTYGEIVPEDGNYDYTIILSGHTDTSWNWKHSESGYWKKDKPIAALIATYSKVGFGAVCVIGMCLISVFMALIYFCALEMRLQWAIMVYLTDFFHKFELAMAVVPFITALGSFFIIAWNDPNEENASRGAMDNATGIALSYEVTRYFKENPDKMPKNCRIIDLNCGSEEVGLRGSMAFAKEHKNDDLLKNAWNINIDSVADKDYFEVVIKDDWQMCRFDKDLEQMYKDTFTELGIESKTNGCIHNPVGGCDSTPMTRAGIKSVTFAAQNPMLTYYYHTFRDTADRFEPETVGLGFEVVLGVIEKIAAFQEQNGFNGVNN